MPASAPDPAPVSPASAGAVPALPRFDPAEFNAQVHAVTSAFGDPTRREIYLRVRGARDGLTAGEVAQAFRSEEHTSELQSRFGIRMPSSA